MSTEHVNCVLMFKFMFKFTLLLWMKSESILTSFTRIMSNLWFNCSSTCCKRRCKRRHWLSFLFDSERLQVLFFLISWHESIPFFENHLFDFTLFSSHVCPFLLHPLTIDCSLIKIVGHWNSRATRVWNRIKQRELSQLNTWREASLRKTCLCV